MGRSLLVSPDNGLLVASAFNDSCLALTLLESMVWFDNWRPSNGLSSYEYAKLGFFQRTTGTR